MQQRRGVRRGERPRETLGETWVRARVVEALGPEQEHAAREQGRAQGRGRTAHADGPPPPLWRAPEWGTRCGNTYLELSDLSVLTVTGVPLSEPARP